MEGVTYLQADVQDDSQIAASFDKMMKLTDGRMSGVSVSLIEPGDFSTGFTATRKSVNIEMASDAYPSYARSLASIENDENNGLKPDYLASRICRIVEKKQPAYRYVVATFLQKLAIFAKWLLPAPAFAWILSIYYKL